MWPKMPSCNDWEYFFSFPRESDTFLSKANAEKSALLSIFLKFCLGCDASKSQRNWTATVDFTILNWKALIHQLDCGRWGRQSWYGKNPNQNKAGERRQNATEKQTYNTTSLLLCSPGLWKLSVHLEVLTQSTLQRPSKWQIVCEIYVRFIHSVFLKKDFRIYILNHSSLIV